MSSHVEKTIATYDRIAPAYALTATPEIRAWEKKSLRMFRELLRGPSVLVVGCGDGRDSRYLSSLGLQVVSLDLSEGMLSEARRHDPGGTYLKRDLRSIGQLGRRFDGVHASGCLYHITRTEFETFLQDVTTVLNSQGVFYLNMKLGSGEEVRAVPGSAYPGGAEAQKALVGERYYCYYSHEELLSSFAKFKILHWQDMSVQLEGLNEYWLSPVDD